MGERTEATEGTEAAGPDVSEALSWVGERLDEIGNCFLPAIEIDPRGLLELCE